MTPKIPKPGRYIRIGSLYVPTDQDVPQSRYHEIYWISPELKHERMAICRAARRPYNFQRIWKLLNEE